MPLLQDTYQPPYLLKSGKAQTLFPFLFRSVNLNYTRERYKTPDNDFFDVDWLKQQSSKLVVILHGLESSSKKAYVKGMARIFFEHGYEVAVINFRGCSGEDNLVYQSYHSGFYNDLDFFLQQQKDHYTEINAVGFSLGGNVLLRYIGTELAHPLKKAVAISAPIDLASSAEEFKKPENQLYIRRFLKKMNKKLSERVKAFDMEMDEEKIFASRSFEEFDDLYTAPAHGYKTAQEYYAACSALKTLDKIQIPALLINAKNDSFLSEKCYPTELAKTSKNFFLCTPENGGHVGFTESLLPKRFYWTEKMALHFIKSAL